MAATVENLLQSLLGVGKSMQEHSEKWNHDAEARDEADDLISGLVSLMEVVESATPQSPETE